MKNRIFFAIFLLLSYGSATAMCTLHDAIRMEGGSSSFGINHLASLIEAGADVNRQDKKGRTPLHIASGEYKGKIVKLLLQNGAKPSLRIKDADGRTPLHDKYEFKNGPAVCAILTYGGLEAINAINEKDDLGYTPLVSIIQFYNTEGDCQAQCARLDSFMRLLEYGANPLMKVGGTEKLPYEMALNKLPIEQNRMLQLYTMQRIVRDSKVTLLLAKHQRCGSNSCAREVPVELLRDICNLLKPASVQR